MAASFSNNHYYIYSVLSNQDIRLQDLTIESVDSYFSDLLDNVKKYIFEQHFDFVFDLFDEMFTCEFELKQEHEGPFIFNNMDFHKVLLSKVHSLQCLIIDSLIQEIQDAYLDYQNILRFSSFLAGKMKIFTLSKFNNFLLKLNQLRVFNTDVIDRYIALICHSLQIFSS